MNKKMTKKTRDTLIAFAFLAPFLVLYAIFTLFPIFQSFWISLHNWEIIGTNIKFIGFKNYERIFNDKLFWQALRNTLQFVFLTWPPLIALGLGLALLLNRPINGIGIFRTLFYMPNVLSVSVTGLIFSRIFASDDRGLVNAILINFGFERIPWLGSKFWAMPVVAATTVWWTVGFNMLIFLAGLQAIPRELYDAAKVDGANAWQSFRHITVPSLRRPFAFVTILQIIASFQLFGQVDVMTSGGPAGYTRTIVYYIYERAFEFWQLGYGAALAVILFFILFIISIIQLYVFRDREAF